VGSAIKNCRPYIEGEWVDAPIDDLDPEVVDDGILEVAELKTVCCSARRP